MILHQISESHVISLVLLVTVRRLVNTGYLFAKPNQGDIRFISYERKMTEMPFEKKRRCVQNNDINVTILGNPIFKLTMMSNSFLHFFCF